MRKDISRAVDLYIKSGFDLDKLHVGRPTKIREDSFRYFIMATIQYKPKSKKVMKFRQEGKSIEHAYANLEARIIEYIQDFLEIRTTKDVFVRPTSTLYHDSFRWLAEERKKKLKLKLILEERVEEGDSSFYAYITMHGKQVSPSFNHQERDQVVHKTCKWFLERETYSRYIRDSRVDQFLLRLETSLL